jgi:hypothetical protein
MLIGEIIRQKIKEDRRTAKVICAELKMSRGNLDKIYHKTFLSTKLIARFSKVLNYDLSVHVGANARSENDEEDDDLVGERPQHFGDSIDVRIAKEQIRSLERELGHLDRTISVLQNQLHDKEEIVNLQKDKINLLEQLNQSMKEKLSKGKPKI